MPQKVNTFNVFLASPSDVSKERSSVEEIINRINKTIGYDRKIVLILKNWETDVRPGFGNDPQDVINKQINFKEIDIFIGIMWNRIGTSNNRYRSGTVEEFENLYQSWKITGKPKLMFYFNRKPFDPENSEEAEQKKQVLEFKEKIEKESIVGNYNGIEDFEKKIYTHLYQEVRSISIINPNDYDVDKKIDCIFLCGGYSKRLWPLTHDFSKVLLPVAGKPLLFHLIKKVLKSKFINKIILSVNKKFEAQIKNFSKKFFNNNNRIDIIVEATMNEKEKLGPIGALNFIVSKLGVRDYLIIGADNLFDFDIDDFIKYAYTKPQSTNAIHSIKLYDDVSEYGVVKVNENEIVSELIEKQPYTIYRNISTACYLLKAKDVKLIHKYIEDDKDPDSLGGFFHWIIDQNSPFACYTFNTFWFDIGSLEKLLQANWSFLKDFNHGQKKGNTKIKSPSQIEKNSIIRDSYIGPNVYIAENVTIIESEIQNSIIMEGAIINKGSITDSIIGPNMNINGRIQETICWPQMKLL